MANVIVLGYDGSECADDALDQAVTHAKAMGGAEIVVVHGQILPAPYHSLWGDAPRIEEDIQKERDDIAKRCEYHHVPMLDKAVARIAEAGVTARGQLVWDDPAHGLLAVAAETGAVLIIVGTHGAGSKGGVGRGSVAYKLLHHATVPVLVVPGRPTGSD